MAKCQKKTMVPTESITFPENLDQWILESHYADIGVTMAESSAETAGSSSSAPSGTQPSLFTTEQQAWIEQLIANRTQLAPIAAAPTGTTNSASTNPGNLGKCFS